MVWFWLWSILPIHWLGLDGPIQGSKRKKTSLQDIQAAIAAANAEYDQKKVIVQNLASGLAPTFADDVELIESIGDARQVEMYNVFMLQGI